MNQVILCGNVGKDPDLKYTASGKAWVNFSLATSEKWTKDGEKHTKTDWHNVVAWGKLAELIAQYVSKGSKVLITGKIQQRSYEKDGEKRWITEIIADTVEFLSGKKDAAETAQTQSAGSDSVPDPESELPF